MIFFYIVNTSFKINDFTIFLIEQFLNDERSVCSFNIIVILFFLVILFFFSSSSFSFSYSCFLYYQSSFRLKEL